jgi:hypothetical protein
MAYLIIMEYFGDMSICFTYSGRAKALAFWGILRPVVGRFGRPQFYILPKTLTAVGRDNGNSLVYFTNYLI